MCHNLLFSRLSKEYRRIATKCLYDLHLSECSRHVLLLLLHRCDTMPTSVASFSATNRNTSSWDNNILDNKIPGRHKNSIISFLHLFHPSTLFFFFTAFLFFSLLDFFRVPPAPDSLHTFLDSPLSPIHFLIILLLHQLIWNSVARM